MDEREREVRMWRYTIAVAREVFRPNRLGGPRPERLEMLERGEIPPEETEDDRDDV